MKKILKGDEPDLLARYKHNNPNNTWDQFRNSNARKNAVKFDVRNHQGGLCAYCEIDLKLTEPANIERDDFRIEHFHPKNPEIDNTTDHNWHLDWNNLIGCCHGGSERNVTDAANRFTSPESSCDVPKGNNNWDDEILNPLYLPAFPALFSFGRSDGSIYVNAINCQTANMDSIKAQQSINLLRLDSGRLNRFRKKVLDNVNVQLRNRVADGMSLEDARAELAHRLLRKNDEGCWPAFFTAIRSYLGDAAEQQLVSIQYKG